MGFSCYTRAIYFEYVIIHQFSHFTDITVTLKMLFATIFESFEHTNKVFQL